MYCLHSMDEEDRLILFIEGRLDSFEEIENVITEKLSLSNNDKGNHHKDKSLIIDLSKTDFISEKCFRAFQKMSSKHKTEFRNYSLYIGIQLDDYHLITIKSDRTEV